MNKGRWAIVIVVLVALGMSVATWPLLRLRRKNELHRSQFTLENLDSLCRQYSSEHRALPPDLKSLGQRPEELLDAWGRPYQYRIDDPKKIWERGYTIWSLGPNPDDPSDDIFPRRRTRP